MQGAFFFAWLNKSRTRDAPTPTNISTKSEPLMLKKGTSASPAIARAKSVLPVPGGPISNNPLGILPPSLVYFLGSFKKSITSSNSALASSIPATSAKVTFLDLSVIKRALLLPKAIALPPPACIWRIKNIQTPTRRIIGNQETKRVIYQESSVGLAVILTPFSLNCVTSLSSFGAYVLKALPLVSFPVIFSPCMVTSLISPLSRKAIISL